MWVYGGIRRDNEGHLNVSINEYITVTEEPHFHVAGFYPPVPFSLQTQNVFTRSHSALTVAMGQYESDTGLQRIYDTLQYDVYFSALTAGSSPTVTSIEGYYDTFSKQATFKVEVIDVLPIQRVLIAYTSGNGAWLSQDLSFDPETQKWMGSSPVRGITYYVRAVNSAG